MEQETGLSKAVAVIACVSMTVFYVAILYAPTLILRLPPPTSLKEFLIRRFICAAISSIVSIILCAFILPIRSFETSLLFGVYGVRFDHAWQAVVFPLSLTSLMYAGSFFLKSLLLVDSWKEYLSEEGVGLSFGSIKHCLQKFIIFTSSMASIVMAWRNFVVDALTEELVFRACMIPLLLCGGFKIQTFIFLSPILFSLAHLNHWMEIYVRHNYSILKASMAVGFQLGYTVIFGSYASFLFIRTEFILYSDTILYLSNTKLVLFMGQCLSALFILPGHLLAPLVAHIFCNFMGLPVLVSRGKGMVSLAFIAGVVTFLWLLFPVTRPDLYNDKINNCRCWHGYCSWN